MVCVDDIMISQVCVCSTDGHPDGHCNSTLICVCTCILYLQGQQEEIKRAECKGTSKGEANARDKAKEWARARAQA